MRIIAPVLGAFPTAFFRVSLASAGLAVLLVLLRTEWNMRGKLKAALALGVINSAIPFVMYSLAAKVLPAGYSAILNATTPLMGVVVGALFFGDKLTVNKAGGVLFGLAGVAMLTHTESGAMSGELLLGVAACLVATTCYAFASFLTKRWISDKGGLDSKLVAFGSQFGAAIALLPFFGYSVATHTVSDWGNGEVWLAVAGLGLLCTSLAYILYFRLIANIGPVRSLTVTFLIPPFGVLWGVLFLHEQLSMAHAYGGALIGVAVWLVLKPAKPAVADMAVKQ
jgi:drug/metabolite transporter (DMT)-like permease